MPPPPTIAPIEDRAGVTARSAAYITQPARGVSVGDLSLIRAVLDLLMLCGSSALMLVSVNAVHGSAEGIITALLFPPLVVGIIRVQRSPEKRIATSAIDAGGGVLFVVSLAAMTSIAIDSILGGHEAVSIGMHLWLYASTLLGLSRILFVVAVREGRRSLRIATPTLVVGAGIVGEQVVRMLVEHREYGLCPVGFLDADPPSLAMRATNADVPLLGGPDNLGVAAEMTGAQRVILAFSSQRDHVLVEVIRRCHDLGLEVSFVPRFYELVNERARLDHLGGLPLLTLSTIDPKGWQFALKHALDRVIALYGLLALVPVLAAIALAVRLSSPGPVLFRQRRVGRDGQEFDLLKFRTMKIDLDQEPGFQPANGSAPGGIEGLDRRTRLGRWLRGTSLDELPQLANVLRGEMSLVGPRPERPEYVDLFVHEVRRYGDRHRVKSGITGWAQVNGLRGQTSITDRVEWDNYYVKNWSPLLDLRILALTAVEMFRFRESA